MTPPAIRIQQITKLGEIAAEEWNQFSNNPFVQHEFLAGLEDHDCLLPHGWIPQHLIAIDSEQRLVGALPLYRKTNSYGEFVFDWSWADAYERCGLRYYPKLVNAIPHTPSVGPRLLVNQYLDPTTQTQLRAQLLGAAQHATAEHQYSSLHCLFPQAEELDTFRDQGLIMRTGFQFHWYNRGYRDFADFLDTLTAKRRKEIKRERRSIAASGIEIEVLHGHETRPEHWATFYDFYCSTFARKWGEPRLTLDFFNYIAEALPDNTLLFLARRGDRYVAGAFGMRSHNALYGRHWGCSEGVVNLHFELCYYQTIDYCITHGLQHLDAGAQGEEHKFPRGFEPLLTYSAHRIVDPRLARPIAAFVADEQRHIEAYIAMIQQHSPYNALRRGNE